MRCVLLLLVATAASALVAHAPMARAAVVRSSGSRAVAPQMMLGGGPRNFLRAIVRKGPGATNPKFPGFGGRSSGGRMDGGDGGDGTGDVSPAPEEPEDASGFGALWKNYNELLETKPLLMKALTSLVGFALGDILAQLFIQKNDPFDFFRLFRLASFGFLVHGTTSHWFYGLLDGKIPGKTAKAVFSKVFIDQVLWNPCFGVMFFSYVALLEAKGIGYVVDKVQNELLTSVMGSWKVWPLAHAINFRFIPSAQRVLYINTIQIGYNCFLSIISNRGSEKA